MINNIIFDRDGIINNLVQRDGKKVSPRKASELNIKKEFIEMYFSLDKRFKLFIASNQPDIARNLMTSSELDLMTLKISSIFSFEEILYCTHDEKCNCYCRKPKPGMINYILSKYSLDKNETVFVGDNWKDISAGISACVSTVLLKTEYNRNIVVKPDYTINSLLDLLKILEVR